MACCFSLLGIPGKYKFKQRQIVGRKNKKTHTHTHTKKKKTTCNKDSSFLGLFWSSSCVRRGLVHHDAAVVAADDDVVLPADSILWRSLPLRLSRPSRALEASCIASGTLKPATTSDRRMPVGTLSKKPRWFKGALQGLLRYIVGISGLCVG